MTLVDSNLLIHAADPADANVLAWLKAARRAVSSVSRVETLGFPHLTPAAEADLLGFFAKLVVWPVTTAVEDEAIRLRRLRKMKLGDSLIAATALVHGCDLAARNLKDFTWVPGLVAFDPS
jgi:toxin FitB